MIDLRSDTLTRPTPAMRQAMANAEVHDDVIDIDPTVDRLQKTIAEMLGKEAAMFMPSGTMTNQVAIKYHCLPGDEILCEAGCHILNYEQGGYAQLSGATVNPVRGTDSQLSVEQLQYLIKPNNEHAVRTRLVALENTHNKGGGVILPLENIEAVCQWAKQNQLRTHLDGARLFNAVVATGISAERWCRHFDTVSVCFSKGLGAPVGSALVGPREMIPAIRRHRKLFGGGMRQSGIIAAGALYALEHHIPRLAEDHAAAQILAEAIQRTHGLTLEPNHVDTNIVIFRIDSQLGDAAKFCSLLQKNGVWMYPFSHCHVRAVTHLDISVTDCQKAGAIISRVAEELACA
ncbi:MAG TPA: GntG family PLP-dependent aldolase [Pirellulaceae bacterium]|nr:GntG family PLP-dependent aldolase [Pirellulaceae bacterium]HMO93886.1 GntG family PLP-dependent aldolase [Pirellulaceae bacterium]HMP70893.1 GntG family PLP-dependent aldolase [Pirellulaceae bacterium]